MMSSAINCLRKTSQSINQSIIPTESITLTIPVISMMSSAINCLRKTSQSINQSIIPTESITLTIPVSQSVNQSVNQLNVNQLITYIHVLLCIFHGASQPSDVSVISAFQRSWLVSKEAESKKNNYSCNIFITFTLTKLYKDKTIELSALGFSYL